MALKFAAKHGIKNEISQIKYQESPGSETYVAVEDDDDLELGMAMVISAEDAANRAITFIIKFSKDLPDFVEEETKEASSIKSINTYSTKDTEFSDLESTKDFMRLKEYRTELLEKNARDIFAELCSTTKIGSMYEDERKVKARHPLAEEFEKIAKDVFNEVLNQKDLEEQDEN